MLLKRQDKFDTIKTTDEIENSVYNVLKPLGFRKYGRTLHRFVSNDISQVVNFQIGKTVMQGKMCVNIGIRIPECDERTFNPNNDKNYYPEHQCTIRSRLGVVSGNNETWYDLRKDRKIADKIIKELINIVIPVFDTLNNRQAFLEHRREYPQFDTHNNHLILLDESMIYGYLGNTQKAKEKFEEYYKLAIDRYNELVNKGSKMYLNKGDSVVYMGQKITAEKNGYITVYGASHEHIDMLDQLAIELKLR